MARYAVVTPTGVVENIIEASPSFQMTDRTLVLAQEGAHIGGTYLDGVFTPPPVYTPTPEELRETFPVLNPAQIRLGLLSIGITGVMVEGALAGNAEGLTEWRYRPTYKRLHPLVESLAVVFQLPPEQVDSLWLWAADL